MTGDHRRQGAIGLLLAASIIAAWLVVHIYGVFFWRWTAATAPLAVLLVALETWLGAGMFIVAHDAMHGTLAPGRPRLSQAVGQAAVGMYAGFDFRKLNAKHHEHHRAPGTAADPDFHAGGPTLFWRWYLQFFTTYFGWWELARLAAVFWVYILVLKVPPMNMLVFWGLPSILSSLQLFTFGTWLPHRHAEPGFADDHRARTLAFGWVASLITCFHFGLHHEHHLRPDAPWWRLPAVRRSRTAAP